MNWLQKNLDSRRIFVETLNELAKTDDKIIVLIPDVGFNYLNDPNLNFKVINTGVTEQSTIMIAVGLALSGYKPWVYSMINFVLFRPYEMIRNGIVHHHANVKLLGVQGGPSYKMLGFSHNLDGPEEDLRVCRNLKLQFQVPSLEEVKDTIIDAYKSDKPVYIRL